MKEALLRMALKRVVNQMREEGLLAYSQGSYEGANQLIFNQREDGKWVATLRKVAPPQEDE